MDTFLGLLLHKNVCLIRFSLTLTMEMKIKASSILKENYLVLFVMYVPVYVWARKRLPYVCKCTRNSEDIVETSETGITDVCELLDLNGGN